MWTKREEDSRSFSINSSKVYCKSYWQMKTFYETVVLIVAKCIVNKWFLAENVTGLKVLIVAKCIVNFSITLYRKIDCRCINSSKVYCKFAFYFF